ncbi:MAG: extracellular solute-binding protein [Bacillota bacterium]|nr:extracellular solute-binding protein [Bacillota bacterium]
MKKLFILLSIFFTVLVFNSGTLNADGVKIILQLNNPKMIVDNVEQEIDPGRGTKPLILNDHTVVPIRAIIEALGGEVAWDESERKISIQQGNNTIFMWLDSYITEVNGESKNADIPLKSINGRTMAPLRYIAENLNFNVDWDNDNKKITISGEKNSVKPTPINEKDVDPKNVTGELSFWHFNVDTASGLIKNFNDYYPNVKVNLSIVPLTDRKYQNKITAAVKSQSGVPDIFPAEASFVKRFVDTPDFYSDITDKVSDSVGNMVPYTVYVGTDKNGYQRALSNQIGVCGFAYKKELAKKYLGTDNPNQIANMLLSEDMMLKTAKTLKSKSNGSVALFPSWEEVKKLYLGSRSMGWVIDNKLTIDAKVMVLIDLAKELRTNNYEAGYKQWSPDWSSAIADKNKALVWLCPSWGIPWIIGANDQNSRTNQKWGIAKTPEACLWGGTWYGIYDKSDKQELAWKFLKFITSDNYGMNDYSEKYEEIPNNIELISKNKYKSKIFDIDLIDFYEDNIKDVNGSVLSKYDDIIEDCFDEAMESYLEGKLFSKAEVIKKFKGKVQNELPEIEID